MAGAVRPGTSGGANSEKFGDLWAGQDHGFDDWVQYKVTEVKASPSSLSDYTTTATCEISDPDWTSANPLTAQYGQWSYASGTTNGQTHVTTSVRSYLTSGPPARAVTTCTFTNRYRARVRVRKTFDDPITAQPSVTADINGVARDRADAAGLPVSPADTTLEHDQHTEWVAIPVADGPISAVTVGETNGDAGDPPVSAYTTTIDCGEGITATLDSQIGKWTLGGIKPGQDVTCTLHNVRKPETPPETPPATPPETPRPPRRPVDPAPPQRCCPRRPRAGPPRGAAAPRCAARSAVRRSASRPRT